MEEEWDVLNSLDSSQQSKRFRPSVELDFNRFETIPQFQLDEDSMSTMSYNDKELLDEEELEGMKDNLFDDDKTEEEFYNEEFNGDLDNQISTSENYDEDEDKVNENIQGNVQQLKEDEEIYSEDENYSIDEDALNKFKETAVVEVMNEYSMHYPNEEDKLVSKPSNLLEESTCLETPLLLFNDSELIIDLEVKDPSVKSEDAFVLLDSKSMNNYNKSTAVDNDSFLECNNERLGHKTTRESLVDKNTTWKNVNSVSGSSVPFISNPPKPSSYERRQSTIDTFNQKPFFNPFAAQLSFSPAKKSVDQPQQRHIINKEQQKKSATLSIQNLHSFAAAPQQPSVWVTCRSTEYDIPPVEPSVDEQEEKPEDVFEKLMNSFAFAPEKSQQLDQIIYNLKNICSAQEWNQLTKLDLSHQHLKSINNFNNIFPNLEYLEISHNELETLSSLPNSLVYLHASNNNLTEVDIYNLHKLHTLNIANNHIHHLEDLSRLIYLRILDASHNCITSCKPFQGLPVLKRLLLKENCIRRLINFDSMIEDNQLEILDVSYNRIESLDSIERLQNLCYLNAEHNDMKYIQLERSMEKLYKLELTSNSFKSIDLSQFPGIRTLYLDDNVVHRIIGINCISRIESFSLRDQGGNKIDYNLQNLRGVRKLYLSGSPFYNISRLIDFFSLEYLELSAAHIEQLPPDFGKHVPNLSTLYLSFNRLSSIRPLWKLKYLKRLVLIDNRIIHMNEVLAVLENLRRLRYLDLRQNPISTNIYPPVSMKPNSNVSQYVFSALDPSWQALDDKFCLTLDPQWLTRRTNYRSTILRGCPKLIELDHVKINGTDAKSNPVSFNSEQSL